MGGDMDNPVVVTVARTLQQLGFAVLRFNFGGVGGSEGSYSGGPAEIDDVGRALAASETGAGRASSPATPSAPGRRCGPSTAGRGSTR
jgi:alpha/beta superfamily hydrolase